MSESLIEKIAIIIHYGSDSFLRWNELTNYRKEKLRSQAKRVIEDVQKYEGIWLE
jgi:hypothetical protein